MFGGIPPLEERHSTADYETLLNFPSSEKFGSDLPDDQGSGIPVAYTYFGQFVAHDITFNPVSDLVSRRDPEALVSFRTPRLDLDSLYGRGPKDNPYLYDPTDDDNKGRRKGERTGRLSVGWGLGCGEEDLPRTNGKPGIALIGDPRNDEHTIISQLHLAFIKLHNRFFEDTSENFDLAQRLTCWHYQWVILHDYLFRVCDNCVLEEIWPKSERSEGIKPELRWFTWRLAPFIPLEFSGAAFRFGHSMVRRAYRLNFTHFDPIPVFNRSALGSLRGFDRLRPTWTVQWDHFLKFDDMKGQESTPPQQSNLIDVSFSPSLKRLPPEVIAGGPRDLRTRNIERGYQLGLPSGQDVARAMGCVKGEDLLEELCPGGDPLWIYVLREAKEQQQGKRLGKIGSTIVAETIIGLIAGDPLSYLNVEPKWKPTLHPGEKFKLRDLIVAAGMPITKEHLQSIEAFSDHKYDPRGALLDEYRTSGAQVRAQTLKARTGWFAAPAVKP
jgi:hypothetical protein